MAGGVGQALLERSDTDSVLGRYANRVNKSEVCVPLKFTIQCGKAQFTV